MEFGKEAAATARAVIGKTNYLTTVTSDGLTITSDEPFDIGGGAQGLTPHQLLLASLGSCTAITLRMYVDRKQWPVEEITVDLDLYNEEGSTLIETRLSVKGELDAQQKERLMHIAKACPIHKLLTNPVKIQTLGVHMK